MDAYTRYLKKRLIGLRMVALLSALIGIAGIFLYFLNAVNPWVCAVIIAYSMAITFTLNSTYQEINSNAFWKKFSMALAFLGFIAIFAIIIYAFVSGALRF